MTTTTLHEIKDTQHISFSQLKMFDKCQLSWFLKYVKMIQKSATIPMVLGKAYHEALALNFRQKIHTAEDLPASEIISEFSRSLEENIISDKIIVPNDKTIEDYTVPVHNLLAHYVETYAPSLQPLLVEQTLEKSINGCNKKIVGILDLLTQDMKLIDFKLSSKKIQAADPAAALQIDCYILLMEQMLKGELHVALKANKKPLVQIVEFSRTRDDILNFKEHLKTVCIEMEKVEAGVKSPSICTGFCSEKMCQYYLECQVYKNSQIVEAEYAFA